MLNLRFLPEIAVVFMLAFGRLGAMCMLLPAVGETGIPVRIRLSLALLLTLMFYPMVVRLYPAGLSQNLPKLIVYLGAEIAVGVFLGLTARMVLAAVQVAGTIIANQLGLGFAMTVDPTQGQQGVVFGNFLSVLAIAMIFVTDLHHLSVAALGSSFTLFRPGEWMPIGDFTETAVKLTADSFKIGLQVSAPFLAFGLIFNLGVGVLAKLMPQFQVFFVSMPASIGAGFLLFALLISTIMLWYMDHVRDGLGRLVAS